MTRSRIMELLAMLNPEAAVSDSNLKTHLEALKNLLISNEDFEILDSKMKLSKLCIELEEKFPDSTVSILFNDKKANKVFHGSSPSINNQFFDFLKHLNLNNFFNIRDWIKEGNIVYNKNILVHDIATSSVCSPFREHVLSWGFETCWSFLFSIEEDIIIAVLLGFMEPNRLPTQKDINQIHQKVNHYKNVFSLLSKELTLASNEQKERYHDILSVIDITSCVKPSFIIHTDNTGHVITYVSPEIKQIIGIDPIKWMGVKKYVDIHPNDYDKTYNKLFEACRTGKATASTHRFKHKDGHWVIVEVHFLPVFNDTGNISYICCEVYENTRSCRNFEICLKEEEDNQIKSFHTIKYVEEGQLSSCHYVSPEIKDILDINPNEWLGFHFQTMEMYGDDYTKCLNVLQQAIADKEEKMVVGRFKIKSSKQYVPLEIHFKPILDPEGVVHKVFSTYYSNTKSCKEFVKMNPILKLLP